MKKIIINIECSNGKKANLYKGFTQYEAPKTWKKIDVIGHNIGNAYNPSHLTLYRAKDKGLRYEIYRDGNFFPYFGRFEYV